MKKLLALGLILGLIFVLSACDGDDIFENKTNMNDNTAQGVTQEQTPEENSTSASNQISREKAIEIALNHAGLKEVDVINLTAELDRELTRNEWEVDFDKDGYEYSYEINAETGKIIKSEKEID